MPVIRILDMGQIIRRANKKDDPRCIFYQAILGSRTVDDYMSLVGDIFVVPPTYQERMGAMREFRYMHERCRWVALEEASDDTTRTSNNGGETDGFKPTPEYDARRRAVREVVTRQGQGQFRYSLLDAYSGSCAVTGCSVTSLLEAAHVTPYLGAYTNDLTNGLLLRADIHSLWDLGLIGAYPSTRILCVSSVVANADPYYKALDKRPLREPRMPSLRPSYEALLHHWRFAKLHASNDKP